MPTLTAGPAPSAEASALPPAGADSPPKPIQVEKHQGLAWKAARKWPADQLHPLGLTHEDLAQIGIAELIRAAAKYDPARGKWSTYAAACATLKIRDTVHRAKLLATGVFGVGGPAEGGEDLEPEGREPDPLGALADAERREGVRELVRLLRPRHQRVLIWKFGLDGEGERDTSQIGAALGVTRQRAHQLVRAAIGRLRRLAGGAGN